MDRSHPPVDLAALEVGVFSGVAVWALMTSI
jgi:hypothetical protein